MYFRFHFAKKNPGQGRGFSLHPRGLFFSSHPTVDPARKY
jgi:hypothetical protein